MKQHYKKILQDTEKRIERSLQIQLTDKAKLPDGNSLYFGGFRDAEGLIEPKFAIYRVTTMIAGFFNQDCRWYGNPAVYTSICNGLEFIRGAQRENGRNNFV